MDEKEDFLCGQPLFRVANVLDAVAHYRDVFGFDVAWTRDDDGIEIASVGRGNLCLLLANHSAPVGSCVFSYVENKVGLDKIYEEFKSKGAKITEPPIDRYWGLYEMRVEDLDGNTIRIATDSEKTEE